jgi:integrase
VFDGVGASQLQRWWAQVRAQVGIPHVRTHDLRHSNASLLARSGASLLAQSCCHSSAATWSRNAHLVDDVLREAAESVGRVLNFAGLVRRLVEVNPRRN